MTTSYSIGVDLGGTNLRVAVMRQEGILTESISLRTRLQEGRDAVIADLCDAVAALHLRHSASGGCVGIGVGTPGPLEMPEGILRRPPNLPGWDGFAVRAAIERRLGQPILLESDANVAALAEAHFGAGKRFDVDSLCMLTLGTGVGNGIVLHGHIWQGMSGMAGEAGHIAVVPEGLVCGCGSRGCLEMYASATGLRRMALEAIAAGQSNTPLARLVRENPEFQAKDVAHLAEGGDTQAQAIFTEMGRCLGLTLAALVNTLNLPLYVLGGGSAAAWPLFTPAMQRELRERSYVYRATEPTGQERIEHARGKTHLVQAELGADSGILGAACLPWAEKHGSSV
ncbi:MAG TPA: ROK family protein [Acidobacteriaceae bacterium]|nr:ROK family protein [Acidobacteriaceae bacterium]